MFYTCELKGFHFFFLLPLFFFFFSLACCISMCMALYASGGISSLGAWPAQDWPARYMGWGSFTGRPHAGKGCGTIGLV